jgi:hypothetical protein
MLSRSFPATYERRRLVAGIAGRFSSAWVISRPRAVVLPPNSPFPPLVLRCPSGRCVLRVEEHFAQVARHFFQYVRDPASMPAWETSFMLAKYYVTTNGVEMARK